VLPHVDVLLCDEREALAIFGVGDPEEALAAAFGLGLRMVAVKLGERGAILSDGESLIRQPAISVAPEQVRDSVGAGDAFDAGLLVALLRGATLAEAGGFATAAAALTLSGPGGAERITGIAAVEAALARVPAPTITEWVSDSLHRT
jgi:sugar/nucleoside kinase (ribokinase family)